MAISIILYTVLDTQKICAYTMEMFMEFFLCISLIGPDDEVELHVVSKHPGKTDCQNVKSDIQEDIPFELHCIMFESPDHPT
jgi:hypothetical protein